MSNKLFFYSFNNTSKILVEFLFKLYRAFFEFLKNYEQKGGVKNEFIKSATESI